MTSLAPAVLPRATGSERLLHIEPTHSVVRHLSIARLPELLRRGDLVVVNDAATLPASLRLTSHDAELRLAAHADGGDFVGALLGAGTWRTPTEQRGPPPELRAGARIASGALSATIIAVDPENPELVSVRFDQTGAAFEAALYASGEVVQYSYLGRPLELWDVQSRFSARPWAFEPPSAGLPLTFELLFELRRRGVGLASVSHAAGLSSLGKASLDRRLPLPERYEIPEPTRMSIERAHASGGRVVAIGTTVVRALESNVAEHGALRSGTGTARLVVGPGFRPRVVDGLFTGMHESTTSHFALLAAFAPRPLLERALVEAAREGYLQHEFGDVCLILRD